jgi:hypothetical protein
MITFSDRASGALQRLGEACTQAVDAMVDLWRACMDHYITPLCHSIIQPIQNAAETQAALKAAPPRVRHLATHSKKRRTRKKNINRALREYRRKR